MKKLIVLSLAICMFSSCYSQQNINAGIYKLKGNKFQVYDMKFKSNRDKNKIGIGDPDYKYQNSPPPPPKVEFPYPMQKKDIHVDLEKSRNIIFNVLRQKLKQLKKSEENLSLLLSISQSGEILNINYGLNQKTFISIKDIAEIDKKIKAEIKVSFTGTDYLQYEIISYSMPAIFFGKLEL